MPISPHSLRATCKAYSVVLRQAVDIATVLTYAPTYWPKKGICAGYIGYSIKFCGNPFASHLTKVTAQPTDYVFPLAAAQCITYRVPIKLVNYFFGG